ncbi:MAG: hypothetical protein Q7J98_05170, partial [Kiritimatiellia bacterium]|nr:hypothetical protein [Kiritimatiellia bacterium]
MFTGLIQQIGKLAAKETNGNSLRLIINTQKWNPPLMTGESISVNGVCLTRLRQNAPCLGTGMNGEPTAAKSREARRSRVSGYAGVPLGSATDAPRLAAGSFTAAEITDQGFACDVLKETINCSNLGVKQVGAALNLERAL